MSFIKRLFKDGSAPVPAPDLFTVEPVRLADAPSRDSELVLIDAACPDCGNVNRAARRRCRGWNGQCNGTGTVKKWVPVEPALTSGTEWEPHTHIVEGR